MNEKNQQLTSVKLDKELFEQFKIECIKRKFSFQKLLFTYFNYALMAFNMLP